MDTTSVKVISKQLDALLMLASKQPTSSLTSNRFNSCSYWGISCDFITNSYFILNRWEERGGLKKELIADERRLAYLLTEYYKELVITGTELLN